MIFLTFTVVISECQIILHGSDSAIRTRSRSCTSSSAVKASAPPLPLPLAPPANGILSMASTGVRVPLCALSRGWVALRFDADAMDSFGFRDLDEEAALQNDVVIWGSDSVSSLHTSNGPLLDFFLSIFSFMSSFSMLSKSHLSIFFEQIFRIRSPTFNFSGFRSAHSSFTLVITVKVSFARFPSLLPYKRREQIFHGTKSFKAVLASWIHCQALSAPHIRFSPRIMVPNWNIDEFVSLFTCIMYEYRIHVSKRETRA